ncbi:MAG: Flp pilus assembly protein CpaB [Planctomycetota bacterium]
MNFKTLIPLIAGLGVGGFALKIGVDTLQNAKGKEATTTQVWTPKMAIPRGTKITEDLIQPLDFPADLVPSGALLDKEQVIGRVPRIDTPAGLPVLDEMLLPPGSLAGIHVPEGYRAVAVKIDEGSGVDFHLEPGCHVDVVGYFTIQKGNERDTVARTLIENVAVAAVGARLSAVSGEEGGKSRPTRAVTLLVKPDKVPTLHLAEQRGKIKLSMRNEEDFEEVGDIPQISESKLLQNLTAGEEEDDEGNTQQSGSSQSSLASLFENMFGGASQQSAPVAPVVAPVVTTIAPPPPPADPPWEVLVYRGGKQEVVRFVNCSSRQRVTELVGAKSEQQSSSPEVSTPPAQPPAQKSAEEVAEELKQDQAHNQVNEEEKDPQTQEPIE